MKFAIIGAFTQLAIGVAGIVGYVENIIKLAHATSIAGTEIVRIIGMLVPPLGAVMGYVG